jgi:hypothetical protein
MPGFQASSASSRCSGPRGDDEKDGGDPHEHDGGDQLAPQSRSDGDPERPHRTRSPVRPERRSMSTILPREGHESEP